jgi:hypothetical protein
MFYRAIASRATLNISPISHFPVLNIFFFLKKKKRQSPFRETSVTHLKNFSFEILREVGLGGFPQLDELEEGGALPLNRVGLANVLLQEVFQELEVRNEPATQSPQELEEEQDLLVLVDLEVL